MLISQCKSEGKAREKTKAAWGKVEKKEGQLVMHNLEEVIHEVFQSVFHRLSQIFFQISTAPTTATTFIYINY